MATKKQRRRREKGRRHEYEIVYVDVGGPGGRGRRARGEAPRGAHADEGIKPTAATKSKSTTAAKPTSRADRVVDPPSWERTLKRAAIFAPDHADRPLPDEAAKTASTSVIVLAALLIVLLIAFMYLMDSFLYRAYQKRQAKRDGGSPPKTK